MEYKLILTEEKINILIEALELYARIGTGQVDAIGKMSFIKEKSVYKKEAEDAYEAIQKALFPELKKNQFYSIKNEKVPKQCKISWSIFQTLKEKNQPKL